MLGYVVGLGKPANELRRSPVDPIQPLYPKPRETSEDRTATVQVTQDKCRVEGDHSFESQRTSNDTQPPQLVVAVASHLIYISNSLSNQHVS